MVHDRGGWYEREIRRENKRRSHIGIRKLDRSLSQRTLIIKRKEKKKNGKIRKENQPARGRSLVISGQYTTSSAPMINDTK